ncbi:MAG: M60 family metallopeptidase [Muribaculaceae bacterium]|nr:M60 family metallopeptidase [Muribaculaceae bacterium]
MKRHFLTLLIVFITVCTLGAVVSQITVPKRSASIEILDGSGPVNGHIYRIVNAGYNDAIVANGAGNLTASEIDSDNEAQLWVAEAAPGNKGVYLRNYKTGYYMTGSRRRSSPWQAEFSIQKDDDKVLLTFIPADTYYFIHNLNSYGKDDDAGTHGFAHEDNSRKVVGWNINSENSKWKLIEETSITAAMLAEKRKTWQSCVSNIEAGKVYHIVNYHYGHTLTADNKKLKAAQADKNLSNQLWLVEKNPSGEGFLIRDYESGKLVTSSLASGKEWFLRDEYVPDQKDNIFIFSKKNQGFGMVAAGSYQPDNVADDYTYAHENNQNIVVGWTINSNPSLWLFNEESSISPSDISAKRSSWECFKKNTLDNALSAIFQDAACTELTPEYRKKNPAQLLSDPNVLALPEGLRSMVTKASSGDWSEIDPVTGSHWDSAHAKKFRIMMAEPFSESGGAAGLAGVQAHGDVNNPTGIVTDNGMVLYIMLDEEPAPGSEFRIAGRTGEGTPMVSLNNTSDGFDLHKGLNILPCDKDLADMIIYYTVRTNNRQRAVTDYKPIKVHIEGGCLNGYFNYEGDELYTPDTNEDWLYYRERARHAMFCLLSKYNTLYIHLNDLEDGTRCLKSLCSPEEYANGKFDLRATMKAWDEMYVAEALIMGWLPKEVIEAEKLAGRDYYDPLEGDAVARDDYYKYLNNRHLGISLRECGFMNATWWRTAYNPSTISSIIREFPTGDFWGPAHEMGHLNQGPMNMAGCTEESNNVFSNVALFYRGKHTSRADFPSVQRRRFNAGENFHQHDTWGTTRMWFQLWLYYHAVGKDKRFYPRLYELLRQNPLRRTYAPGHEGVENPMLAKDDQLHFATMVCKAAGEDLTDFFDAWGFLEVQDGYYIGDYTSYTSYLSAEDIQEWRSEIARLAEENNWKKNRAIIFIDDRVGSDKQSYAFDKNKCGSMGGLKDFIEGAPVNGEYCFTLKGTTVEVTGATGGVGFIIHDDKGELIGFANEPVFDISEEAARLIREGKFKFEVICHDNTSVPVVDAVRDGSLDQRLQALDLLLDEAEKILICSDVKGLNPGFLKPEVVADLRKVYDSVKGLRASDGVTVDNNVELYNELYDKYVEVKGITATEENTIPVTDGGVYVFTSNLNYNGKGIRANNAGTHLGLVEKEEVDLNDESQQWIFEATDEEDFYYIRNVRFDKYIGKAPADKGIVTLVETPVKQLVKFRELGGISISPEGIDHESLHADDSKRLTRWDSSSKASRWTLTMINDWEQTGILANLKHWVELAENLLNEVAEKSGSGENETWVAKTEYQYVTEEMITALSYRLNVCKQLLSDADRDTNLTRDAVEKLIIVYEEVEKGKGLNLELLTDLVEKTAELIDAIGSYQIHTDKIDLTGDLLYSNACHTAPGSDQFSTWDVLLDGDVNTYFHSTYQKSDTPDGSDHYIRIELPKNFAADTDLVLTYVTRNGKDYNWYPTEAEIQYSEDGENWTTKLKMEEELPFSPATSFESVPFTVPADTRFVRFIVTKNRQSANNDRIDLVFNHPYFAISELGLNKFGISCKIDKEGFPTANEKVYTEAVRQYLVSSNILKCQRMTNSRIDESYNALLPHYALLKAIYDDAGVEEVFADDKKTDSKQKIFTIEGIPVEKINRSGLYIINGRKVFVKK